MWTSGPGASTQIQAPGRAVTVARAGDSSLTDAALGGRLSIEAGTLAFSGNVRLPSGQVSLSVDSGSLNLDAGARIDVSGRTVGLARPGVTAGTLPCGPPEGDVVLNPSARLDLGGSRGGSLELTAAGRAKLAGSVAAEGTTAPGSFRLDQGTAKTPAEWSALFAQLAASGFGDTLACGCAKEISMWRPGRA